MEYFVSTKNNSSLADEVADFMKAFPAHRTEIISKAIADAENGKTRMLDLVRKQRAADFHPDSSLEVRETVFKTDFGAIPAQTYRLKSAPAARLPALLYIHGGGWVIGSVKSCAKLCADIAMKAGCFVAAIDYSLAPETKFPQPVRECCAAFRFLRDNAAQFGIDRDNIGVAGDSSGGNLALASTIKLIEKHNVSPKRAAVFYPVADVGRGEKYASWGLYGSGFTLDSALMNAFTDAYFDDDSLKPTELASPVNYSGFAKFPPTLIVSSGRDILSGQSYALAQNMRAAGAKVRHTDVAEAVHIYMTMDGMPKSYDIGISELLEFLRRT